MENRSRLIQRLEKPLETEHPLFGNGFFFFTDKEMFEKTCRLFEIRDYCNFYKPEK